MKVYLALETAPGSIEDVREITRSMFVELQPHQVFGIYDLIVSIDDPAINLPSKFYEKYISELSMRCKEKLRGITSFFVLKNYEKRMPISIAENTQSYAYIMLSLIPYMSDSVFEKIKELDNVCSVNLCSGVFDGIVEVSTKSLDALSDLVDEIQTFPGVMKTVTLIVKKP
ncbi:MAG: Lrp/AsnC ligand binding domain-containing protein [Candidatus Bathyarchaeia archaeon]